MMEYKFVCPYCRQEARIVERTSLIRDTQLIGFNIYEKLGPQPEFSLEEDFDEDQADNFYACSKCEHELKNIGYTQLFDYIRAHGEVSGATD